MHIGPEAAVRMNCQPKIKLATAWRSASRLDITDRVQSLGDAAMLCMLATLNADGPGQASAITVLWHGAGRTTWKVKQLPCI